MKEIKMIAAFLVVTCLCIVLVAAKWITNADTYKENATTKGFVVVELFTSEGCSSCPAADEVVAKAQKENKNEPVYILAYHVDYWNRLGWKDVFSSADYSKRQNKYAEWLKLQSIYTPQVVVNGSKEFVGSQESTLRSVIKDDLQKSAIAKLILKDVEVNQQKIALKYQTENVVGNNISLVLAVVQKSAVTKVEHGENGGRTLAHVQIVRTLQTIALNGAANGKAVLDLPSGLNQKDLEVISFLQRNTTGEIIAADKIQL